MATRLRTLTIVGLLLGGTNAARSTVGAFGRSLLQQQSALCGTQGYIIGQSYCVSIPTTTGTKQWICPAAQPCACPTTQTGLNPFSCYDPTAYSCSDAAPNWPKSGLISGVGMSDQGACPSISSAAPAPAPVPAPAPGPSAATAPISQPAPSVG
ncbi:hypothetical protein WJX82_000170 [Trebouxia sp. C0006]